MKRQPKYQSIIYDFDGVILDTVSTKISAFASVYRAEPPSKVAEVLEYAEANGGMSRYEKFRHFERNVFRRLLSDARLEALCSEYGAFVEKGVASARFIDGAPEAIMLLSGFMNQHVVSAAPEGELNRALSDRGLRRYFRTTAGAPKSKLAEFQRILLQDGVEPGDVLAIGDSLTEYRAALELGIPFLAIVPAGAPDRFPEQLPKRPDLTDLVDLLEPRLAGQAPN